MTTRASPKSRRSCTTASISRSTSCPLVRTIDDSERPADTIHHAITP